MGREQIWLGDVRSGTPGTSETTTTGGLLHQFPELSPLELLELERQTARHMINITVTTPQGPRAQVTTVLTLT